MRGTSSRRGLKRNSSLTIQKNPDRLKAIHQPYSRRLQQAPCSYGNETTSLSLRETIECGGQAVGEGPIPFSIANLTNLRHLLSLVARQPPIAVCLLDLQADLPEL